MIFFILGLVSVVQESGFDLNSLAAGMESWIVVGGATVYILLEGWEFMVLLAKRFRESLMKETREQAYADGEKAATERWMEFFRSYLQAEKNGSDRPAPPSEE